MVDQLTQTVREVHLTVTWRQGKVVESMDVVTHIVSLGPGSDRNGGGAFNAATGGTTQGAGNEWSTADGRTVPNPVPGPNGGMIDPATGQPVFNRQGVLDRLNNPGSGLNPPFNNRGSVSQ